MYKVSFASRVEKQLDKISNKNYQNIITHISALSHNPRPDGCKKLAGFENIYRIRIGNYRVIYNIKDEILTVLVVKIGHRRDVYK